MLWFIVMLFLRTWASPNHISFKIVLEVPLLKWPDGINAPTFINDRSKKVTKYILFTLAQLLFGADIFTTVTAQCPFCGKSLWDLLVLL